MPYFDAHCHLLADEVFLKAQEKNVRFFCVNTTHPDEWERASNLSHRISGISVCAGIHPWFVDGLPNDWQMQLEQFLQNHPTAMVGEIGLDATRPFYPLQKQVFSYCLELASRYQRQVHIHCVKAWPDMLEILMQYRDIVALLHRFSGDEVIIRRLSLTNTFFSVLNQRFSDIIPDDRILVESDAPDGLSSPENIPELVRNLKLDEIQLMYNWESFLNV